MMMIDDYFLYCSKAFTQGNLKTGRFYDDKIER
jgi:hypothetical protein